MLTFPYMYIMYSDHIHSQPPPCVPFLLPPSSSRFQEEVSGCVLHPLEDTELDEKQVSASVQLS